jgi:hypothetical protein
MREIAAMSRNTVAWVALAASIGVMSCARTPDVEWHGHRFQEVATLEKLPPAIRSALGVDRPGTAGVADRGRPFNETDVTYREIPFRRLVTAGRDGDTWIVAIERGGRAYGMQGMVFELPATEPREVHNLAGHPKSLGDVLRQMP